MRCSQVVRAALAVPCSPAASLAPAVRAALAVPCSPAANLVRVVLAARRVVQRGRVRVVQRGRVRAVRLCLVVWANRVDA